MLQILTVCGAGLGSSFACQMSVDAVLKELGVEAKLDHTDISSVGGAKADIILSGKNFEKQFERDMRKKDLCAAAGISHASMAKLGKNENVTTDVLVKICTALQCDIGDIMEITDSSNN